MLKTTTNKARQNIRQYIIAHCDGESYIGYTITKQPETWEEVAAFIRQTFRDEKRYQIGNQQELFIDWCQGLPSALDTCYYYNRSAVDDLAVILEETEEEKAKYTEEEAEYMLSHLIYRELFTNRPLRELKEDGEVIPLF